MVKKLILLILLTLGSQAEIIDTLQEQRIELSRLTQLCRAMAWVDDINGSNDCYSYIDSKLEILVIKTLKTLKE